MTDLRAALTMHPVFHVYLRMLHVIFTVTPTFCPRERESFAYERFIGPRQSPKSIIERACRTARNNASCNFCIPLIVPFLFACFSDGELMGLVTELKTGLVPDLKTGLMKGLSTELVSKLKTGLLVKMNTDLVELKKEQTMDLSVELGSEMSAEEELIIRVKGGYRCGKCDRIFQRKYSLARHLRYSCGKEPQFKCPYCNYRSNLRSNTYRHVRLNHKSRTVSAHDIVNNCIVQP